jgi:hypothetical protein
MALADIRPVLDSYRDRSSNYGTVALFDHLPMAVAALAEMGAIDERLSTWAHRYAHVHALRPVSEAERTGRERWLVQLRDRGRAAVISENSRLLADGFGTSAFHAAIRAAYAYERSDDEELAAALEAWQREYLALPGVSGECTASLEAALAELAAAAIPVTGGELIATRMANVGRHPHFASLAAAVPSVEDLDGLALAAAAAFAQSGNFTALHVMTATHAARILMPVMIDDRAVMSGFWRAYAAAACVAGTVPTLDPAVLGKLRAEAPNDWGPLLAKAVDHDDEHVIKSTYTAWRLDRSLRDAVYRSAAARYLDAA